MTMRPISLDDYQVEALHKMKNGCILYGGVGSGKSRTSLCYYYECFGGKVNTDNYIPMLHPCDLYIITTARKRDTYEWDEELMPFRLPNHFGNMGMYECNVTIDSWNNIKKYVNVRNSFFIFDEQRVVGWGAWTKSFLKIARYNKWILLTATPGDKWEDYIPVFVANGFYHSKTQFYEEHVVLNPYTNYRQVMKYLNTGQLMKYKHDILIDMDYKSPASKHHETVLVEYDKPTYNYIVKTRWNPVLNKPIENASEYCQLLRKVVNSDPSRVEAVLGIAKTSGRCIIFYSYDYELEILRKALTDAGLIFSEWNGHKHEKIPDTEKWVYLVEYFAGAEGWNCTVCNTVIFYSQTYSYKQLVQSAGRIDRRNTPYQDLYYYHLKSMAKIDIAIANKLGQKKKFNEADFAPKFEKDISKVNRNREDGQITIEDLMYGE